MMAMAHVRGMLPRLVGGHCNPRQAAVLAGSVALGASVLMSSSSSSRSHATTTKCCGIVGVVSKDPDFDARYVRLVLPVVAMMTRSLTHDCALARSYWMP